MSDYATVTQERSIGIVVDVGDGEIRPVWRRLVIEWPDWDIAADVWDAFTPAERVAFLEVKDDGDGD